MRTARIIWTGQWRAVPPSTRQLPDAPGGFQGREAQRRSYEASARSSNLHAECPYS